MTSPPHPLLRTASIPPVQGGVVSDGVYNGEVGLQVVPPLGSIRFIVEPRVLPLISSMEVRLDSSIKDMPGAWCLQAPTQGLGAVLSA